MHHHASWTPKKTSTVCRIMYPTCRETLVEKMDVHIDKKQLLIAATTGSYTDTYPGEKYKPRAVYLGYRPGDNDKFRYVGWAGVKRKLKLIL